MIGFCKIFYVSFIELLVLLHSLYRYFMGSDPNIQKYDIPELQTFINGIKKDLTAVKNGIIYSYNNGSAEGSVNKIKVIKRIMYGRNSFELLKAKVLFGELFHVKFN